MANLIARIAVLLVLAAAGMVLADRKEKIDLSVSLLLFLAAVNVTSFFSLKDNRIVVVMILTVYFLLHAGAKELLRETGREKENECKPNIRLRAPMQKCRSDVFEFSCKFKKQKILRAGSRCRAILQKNSIWKDAARIHQLVSLLVDNAVKYTPDGGKSTFSGEETAKSRIFGAEYLRYPAEAVISTASLTAFLPCGCVAGQGKRRLWNRPSVAAAIVKAL